MQYSFPPQPPGYAAVLIARWLLVLWAIIGVGILCYRIRQWKFMQYREMYFWCLAVAVSWVVLPFGICRFQGYDDGRWLVPAFIAANSISIAGIVTVYCKAYCERKTREKNNAILILAAYVCWIGWVIIPVSCYYPREAGSRTQCRNNLKQIGLGMYNYEAVCSSFLPSVSQGNSISWRVSILPFVEQIPLYKQYDLQLSWDYPPNDKLASRDAQIYSCLSNWNSTDKNGRRYTAYSMPVGPHTIGENPTGTPIREITDGTANTLLVVEACGSQIIWTEPRDVNAMTQPIGVNQNGPTRGTSAGWMSSYHYAGSNVLLADGTVRFISQNTDVCLLKKMATIDGGEAVGSE